MHTYIHSRLATLSLTLSILAILPPSRAAVISPRHAIDTANLKRSSADSYDRAVAFPSIIPRRGENDVAYSKSLASPESSLRARSVSVNDSLPHAPTTRTLTSRMWMNEDWAVARPHSVSLVPSVVRRDETALDYATDYNLYGLDIAATSDTTLDTRDTAESDTRLYYTTDTSPDAVLDTSVISDTTLGLHRRHLDSLLDVATISTTSLSGRDALDSVTAIKSDTTLVYDTDTLGTGLRSDTDVALAYDLKARGVSTLGDGLIVDSTTAVHALGIDSTLVSDSYVPL